MRSVRTGTKTFLLVGCISLSCASFEPTQAMPVTNLAGASRDALAFAQSVACGRYRCRWRPSYSYAPAVVIPRVYYGGCAPGWVDCWTYPYGGWYRPPGTPEGYYGWPYY
jgi:hypothetical protein